MAECLDTANTGSSDNSDVTTTDCDIYTAPGDPKAAVVDSSMPVTTKAKSKVYVEHRSEVHTSSVKTNSKNQPINRSVVNRKKPHNRNLETVHFKDQVQYTGQSREWYNGGGNQVTTKHGADRQVATDLNAKAKTVTNSNVEPLKAATEKTMKCTSQEKEIATEPMSEKMYLKICDGLQEITAVVAVLQVDRSVKIPLVLFALLNYTIGHVESIPSGPELMKEVQLLTDENKVPPTRGQVCVALMKNTWLINYLISLMDSRERLRSASRVGGVAARPLTGFCSPTEETLSMPSQKVKKAWTGTISNKLRPNQLFRKDDKKTVAEMVSYRNELKEMIARRKLEVTCRMCLDRSAVVLSLPCAHISACPACITDARICPICRTEIRATVRTYRM